MFHLLVAALIMSCEFEEDKQGNYTNWGTFEGKNGMPGAIAANSELSAKLGLDVLEKGGSAADAAITALLAEGLANPQSMGVGGGFLLTYYDKAKNKVEVLNAREYAPHNATVDMFKSDQHMYHGGLMVGVPGELRGYWDLHKRYGKLPWDALLQPIIECCENGIPVTQYSGRLIYNMKEQILRSPTLKEIFCKENSQVASPGDLVKRPNLANTLKLVAEKGPDVLYDGALSDEFVKEITEAGGIITREDLATYRTCWMKPLKGNILDDFAIYSPPPPSSGSVLIYILKLIMGMPKPQNEFEKWFRMVETWKHAFGYRCHLDGPTKLQAASSMTLLDMDCLEEVRNMIIKSKTTNEDYKFYSDTTYRPYIGGGTCHISVLAPTGDAVSVTSSINSPFGAMFASRSTGIILNNHMMDFNYYQDPVFRNEIGPDKQPLSSMSPSIVINNKNGDVRLIIGAAGSTKIITTISQILQEHMFYGLSIQEAITNYRLHHQLTPMLLYYEQGFPNIEMFEEAGHTLKMMKMIKLEGFFVPRSSAAAIISVEDSKVIAAGDPRRNGCGLVSTILK